MKVLTKRMKAFAIAVLSLLMAVCIIATTGIFSNVAKAQSQNYRTDYVANGDFENLTLTDGYGAPNISGAPTTSGLADGGTAGFVKDDFTNNSTALRFRTGYVEYSMRNDFNGKVEGLNYKLKFDAAAGNTSASTKFIAALVIRVYIFYTNTSGASNKYAAITASSSTPYITNPNGAGATLATWNNIELSFNYTLSGNDLIFNSVWGGDAIGNSGFVNKENTVEKSDVKSIDYIAVRFASNASHAYLYLDNVELYSEVEVDPSIYQAKADKTPSTNELFDGGNMSQATVGDTNTTTPLYLNKAKTIQVAQNASISRVVSGGSAGSTAVEFDGSSATNYLYARTTEMKADTLYEYSFDIKMNATYDNGLASSTLYNHFVWNSDKGNASIRMEGNADGTVNTTSTFTVSSANKQTFKNYYESNVNGDPSKTLEDMIAGEDFCGWTTVKYQVWYELDQENSNLIIHTKRLTKNSDSKFVSYTNGDIYPEMTYSVSGATKLNRVDFRLYINNGSALVDNLSLVEVKQDITDGAVSVYVDAEGNIYQQAGEGLTEVSLKLENGYGASIRYDVETPGIRFRALFGKAGFDALGEGAQNIEFGMLFGATDKVGTELRIGQAGVVKKANDISKSWYLNEEGDKYCYNMSVIEIAEENYDDNITVQSYMIITFANGETITVYGEVADIVDGDTLPSNVRSVAGVAQTLIDDGKETDAGRLEILNKFAGNN